MVRDAFDKIHNFASVKQICGSLCDAVSSGDDVEPVDQSAAASAGADSYVSLRSEKGFIMNDQSRKKPSGVDNPAMSPGI